MTRVSIYYFKRWGTLFRDDHPMALYAGRRRLSPEPVMVWWWPVNWIVAPIIFPLALFVAIRTEMRKRRASPAKAEEETR